MSPLRTARAIGATRTARHAPETARRWSAALLTVALHGGLLVVVFVFAGDRVEHSPPPTELTEIVVVAPPPPPPPPPRSSQPPAAKQALTGLRGHRGRDAPQRSLAHAPAVKDPFADLSVGYEAPITSPDPGARGGLIGNGTGAGSFGFGSGAGAPRRDPVADLRIPPPPPPAPSLARPPRPRNNYSAAVILGSGKFGGATVKVHLDIDAHGVPHDVKVVQHVDDDLDRDAIDQARRFRFEPALDDDGQPAPGGFTWSFVIQTGIPTAEVPDMCLTPQPSGPPLRLPCPRTFAPTRAREDRR